MGSFTALNAAVSGLRTTQAGIDLVSQNIANAGSAGYTRRRLQPSVAVIAGERTMGVQTGAIERVLDTVAQRQLRMETSGAAYTSFAARVAADLDRLFGKPGGAGSLDGAVNAFTTSLQGLASDPASSSARAGVLDRAQSLAARIASIAEGVQGLRSDAENRIGEGVRRVNDLLAGIAELNGRVIGSQTQGGSPDLLDERDRLVTELSTLIDVQTIQGQNGSISLSTPAGLTLFNGQSAVKLNFDGRGTLAAQAQYDADPAFRGVGTITITPAVGQTIDVVERGLIRSGELRAALDMRDEVLVQAQRQLDELAAGLSLALSETRQAGTPFSAGGGSGFTLDLSAVQPGDVINLSYREARTGLLKEASILVRSGAGSPAFPTPGTSQANLPIFELDIGSPDFATGVAALAADLGAAFTVTSTAAPQTLSIRNSNADIAVQAMSLSSVETSLTGGSAELPFFTDPAAADGIYRGVFQNGSQLVGFAQRIAVNPALLAQRDRLVVYGTVPPTPQGDSTRPQHLVDALTRASRSFSGAAGLNGRDAPTTGSVADFARRVVETQGANAESVARLNEGQQVALRTVEAKYADTAGVNIDQEMAQLVQLQTAYAANARVMTAARDMLDLLLRI